jgi:flagellar biogenesis protein FliO
MGLSEQILYVVLVFGLLLAVLAVMKRFSVVSWPAGRNTNSPRRMELVERINLTAQHSIHLIRIDGRLLFVGVSPSGCHLLESSTHSSKSAEALSA